MEEQTFAIRRVEPLMGAMAACIFKSSSKMCAPLAEPKLAWLSRGEQPMGRLVG